MITYTCDLCHQEVDDPTKFATLELLIVPHDTEGAVHYDAENRTHLAQSCGKCADWLEKMLKRLVTERIKS